MRGYAGRWMLALTFLLVMSCPITVWGQAIKVLVDGEPLTTSAPPREVGGRIMVGMRDIFERLGAEVKWDAAERRITAMRGARTVVLWIGRNYALINEAPLPLDVPPMLIGGFTYVPVRFPSEALGANVGWLSATRTVLIDTSTMPPVRPEPAVPEPSVPEPSIVEPVVPPITSARGAFLQLIATTPRAIVIRSYETDNPETYLVAPNATFRRGEASAASLSAATAQELIPGDDVTLRLNALGQAESIEARYQVTKINYRAAAANTLLADDGSVYRLAADLKVIRQDAGTITLADLGVGENITLRQNPVDGVIWEITAPAGPAPPPPPEAGPRILMIGPENYTRPLRQNETLTVKMEGTPGGQATFDVGTAVLGQKMVEGPKGVYRGAYRVKATDEVVNAYVIGHLTVGGKEAPIAQSESTVTLDAIKPTIESYVPTRDAVLNTNRPVVQVIYSDGNGAGVDIRSVTLHIGGENLTSRAHVSESSLTYYAPEMPDGQYKVHFRGADLAGNQFTELHWQFTIDTKSSTSPIHAVAHAPAGVVLTTGDKLVVGLYAEPRGRSASFDIVGLRTDIAMTREGDENSGQWRGEYTVRAGDKVADAIIRATFVDRNGKTYQMEDPQRVTIDAQTPVKLVIQQPTNGATVPEVFDLSGIAGKRRTVTYEVTYQGRLRVLGTSVTGPVQSGQVKADANGNWAVSVDTRAVRGNPLLARVDQFTIKCVMLDRNGNPAEEVTISVKP